MTGFGNVIVLEHDRVRRGRRACRRWWCASARPRATMSPVNAASMSSRWLACICRMRPTRSLRSCVEFSTCEPAAEHAGVHAHVRQPPDVGVGHDLERQRGERLLVVGLALDLLVLLGRGGPRSAGTSSGDGRYCTIASSSGWTPLFLNAEPHSTGHAGRLASVAAPDRPPQLLDAWAPPRGRTSP